MATNATACTYCDPPVPAAKTCLRCEASLCEDHLKVHATSEGHILIDPTNSLESRKCSIHDQSFKFYCTEDSLCICLGCLPIHELQKHQLQTLPEASEKVKEDLQNAFEKLSVNKGKRDREVQSLEEYKSGLERKLDGFSKNLAALFHHAREQLDFLEKQTQGEICRHQEKAIQPVSDLIRKLDVTRDEMSKKMGHIEELCQVTDPITILQEGTTYNLPDVDTTTTISRCVENLQNAGDLDQGLIFVTLYKGLSDIMTDIKKELYTQEAVLLDVKTAGEYVDVLSDLKMAKSSERRISRPKASERFQYSQVISVARFSAGRHYWEVQTSDTGNWRFGVCYPSIDRKGEQSYIGDNSKSWCLGGCNKLYSVMHNKKSCNLYLESAMAEKIGVYLDYEAGRLSFYELGDPVKLLHTFSATFTEPLHAAFGVWNSSLKILS
ncbi:PREDICTED: E3 ubiquitin/ISG15 ligase TRIM25-like [Nanorana parkeri]|uniref:E3 ubiquitin/ISG15 ligase TRIM25-like n=1 Tax=Nanorana parkeri TaxID=125878 RepID=UPI000854ED94|nr:PREDICTED: E3 ubiquitin/ISG15 ligase TRIM25-like [Nanorana parkeri]